MIFESGNKTLINYGFSNQFMEVQEIKNFGTSSNNSEVVKMTGNKPKKKFVSGNISISVWENEHEKEGRKFTMQTYTPQKSYKDGEEWKESKSYTAGELLALRSLIDAAIDGTVKVD